MGNTNVITELSSSVSIMSNKVNVLYCCAFLKPILFLLMGKIAFLQFKGAKLHQGIIIYIQTNYHALQ